MQNSRTISELLKGGKALSQLRARAADRARVLDHVRAVLPDGLSGEIVSAGLEGERLTIGVGSAAWATRLRFHAGEVREALSARLGTPVSAVRIRIVYLTP